MIISILICLSPTSLSAQDLLSTQVEKFNNIDTSQYSRNQLLKHQYIQKLLQNILTSYNQGQYKKALKLLKNAHRVISEIPNNIELETVLVSVENIIKIKQSESEHKIKNENHKKLDWAVDETSTRDQARYLFGLWIYPDFDILDAGDRKGIFRSGSGLTVEFFLPYLERSIGFSGSFSGSFLDFNTATVVKDYVWYRYSAFFQYRLTWNLPAIEQASTLTIRAGVNGQFVQELIPKSFPAEPLKNQIMPYIGLNVQDPLLNRIFQNNFNKNLIFHPTLSFEYLPGDQESIGFGVSLGIYYRVGNFLIGPQYAYRLYHDLKGNIAQNNSRISLIISTQI